MKKYLILLSIIILLSSCNTINKTSTPAVKPVISQELIFLKLFHENFPKAEIVGKIMSDLNNDNEKDLIVIYNNVVSPTKTTRTNICFITKDSINGLDLVNGDTNFYFENGSNSLKMLKNPTRASVIFYDEKDKKKIDFQVTFTQNIKLNQTNLKIETIDLH